MIFLGLWELTVMFQMSCVLAVHWDGCLKRTWLCCKAGQTESYLNLPVSLEIGTTHCLELKMIVSLEWMPALTPWIHTRQFPPPLHQMCHWKTKKDSIILFWKCPGVEVHSLLADKHLQVTGCPGQVPLHFTASLTSKYWRAALGFTKHIH